MSKECQRELSGQFVHADCQCPVCGGRWAEHVEVEHAQSLNAWMLDGALAIICPTCVLRKNQNPLPENLIPRKRVIIPLVYNIVYKQFLHIIKYCANQRLGGRKWQTNIMVGLKDKPR